MRHQPRGLYAIALAILAVGLIALGVPVSTLLLVALLLTCPLMMMFMHGGHGNHGDHAAVGPRRQPVQAQFEPHDDHRGHDSPGGRR